MNLFDPSKAKKKKKKKVIAEGTEEKPDKENAKEELKTSEIGVKFVAPFTYTEMLDRIKSILTKQNPNLISSNLVN